MAGPVGDLETSPLYPIPTEDRFPYTFGCFRGIPSDWTQTTVGEAPILECIESGVTDDYVAKAVDGITDMFWYAAQDATDAPTTEVATPSPTDTDTDSDTTPSPTVTSDSDYVQITGWIYADNWFELYFNGEKVATDTIESIPNNAMYVDFTAPAEGSYSFAFMAQGIFFYIHNAERNTFLRCFS